MNNEIKIGNTDENCDVINNYIVGKLMSHNIKYCDDAIQFVPIPENSRRDIFPDSVYQRIYEGFDIFVTGDMGRRNLLESVTVDTVQQIMSDIAAANAVIPDKKPVRRNIPSEVDAYGNILDEESML